MHGAQGVRVQGQRGGGGAGGGEEEGFGGGVAVACYRALSEGLRGGRVCGVWVYAERRECG